MNLSIDRIVGGPTFTGGVLKLDKFCDVVEDLDRDKNKDGDLDEPGEGKVYGETAIPPDTYEVLVTWSPKFGKFMLLITGVKGFSGIRIHGGRDEKDSLGCPLIGFSTGEEGHLTLGPKASKLLLDYVLLRCAQKDASENPIEYMHPEYGRSIKLKEQIFITISNLIQ